MAPSPETALIPSTTVSDLCASRDAAIQKMERAATLMKEAEEAAQLARRAHQGAPFALADRSQTGAYQRLFNPIDVDVSLRAFRHQTDAKCWMRIFTETGMENLMDRTRKEELYTQLCGEVPPISEDAIWDTLEGLRADAPLIFARGLARVFSSLDRRFKSHDAFKIGSRIILPHMFDESGFLNYYGATHDHIGDVERVLAVLDGKDPNARGLMEMITEDRRKVGWGPRQSETKAPYFKVRTFKNGNAHLWFTRDDLVEKANLVLADYYGQVLPDGVPADYSSKDIRERSTALCKDLQFYPTPPEVVKEILRFVNIRPGGRVLEPSAGEGAFVHALLAKGLRVDGVEVDPKRLPALRELERKHPQSFQLLHANFLAMAPRPLYDAVVMNPPFYGTHYMQHIMLAFEWLKPGGTLAAVMPSSVEFGESKAHRAFRAWLKKRGGYRFYDLPQEAFASSGTRINTCYVVLGRAR